MRRALAIGQGKRGQVDASLAIVNIVLLLIFFFLMAGTFLRPEEVPVEPAVTSSLPLERLPRPLLVIVSDENWQLEGQSLHPEELGERLGTPAPTRLHVLAAKNVPARVLAELGARRELAETQILLVTLHQNLAVAERVP